MRKVKFDVMYRGYFQATLEMPFFISPIPEEDIKGFVEDHLPTLRGKDFKIEFYGRRIN